MRGSGNAFFRAAVLAICLATPSVLRAAEPKPASLAALTAKITTELGELTTPEQLYDYPDFNKILADPKPRLRETLDFLGSPEPAEDRKIVAVYAMQKLPFDEYLSFLETLLRLLDDGKITPDVFQNGAFPPLEWNTTLAENYKNPKVRAFLLRLKKSPKTKALRSYAARILSGEAAKDVAKLRADGKIPK